VNDDANKNALRGIKSALDLNPTLHANDIKDLFDDIKKQYEERIQKIKVESEVKEKELRERISETERQTSDREKAYQANFDELRRTSSERSAEAQKLFANLEKERRELEKDKSIQLAEISKERAAVQEIADKNSLEGKERLQTNSAKFVVKTLDELVIREKELSNISFWTAVSGGVVLLVGIFTFVALALISGLPAEGEISWAFITFYSIKGSIIAGLVLLAVKYISQNSNRYLAEYLNVSNRIHSIKFGQFYVETYGVAADWHEVRDAFSGWNGSAVESSSSSEKEDDVDALNVNLHAGNVEGLVKVVSDIQKIISNGKS
jgi:hypothetical protein